MKCLFCLIFLSVLSLQLFTQTIISREEYEKLKNVNEIFQIEDSDILIIPENMLNEFMKSFKPKQNQTLNKITDITLDGYVTDALTKQSLEGIKVTADIWDGETHTETRGPILTDMNGYFKFTGITDVDDYVLSSNHNLDAPYPNPFSSKTIITVPVMESGTCNLILADAIGQQIAKFNGYLNRGLHTFTINDPGASGIYLYKFVDAQNSSSSGKIVYLGGGVNSSEIILHNGERALPSSLEKSGGDSLEKIMAIWSRMTYEDTLGIYHNYIAGGNGNFTNNFPRRSIALPPVVFLPDSMQFTDNEVSYPINTVVRLWQYMCRIVDKDDYKSIGVKLMPMKVYDPNTQPQWSQSLEDGVNNLRSRTTTEPDGLVQMTTEYREPSFANGFSQINVVYADSSIMGQDDQGILLYYSSLNDAFVGGDLYNNISTNQQPIDIFKAVQRNIQVYVTGGIYPINNPKYFGTNARGEPYEPTEPEMQIIDMTRNMQDVIQENSGERIFINRFLHPGDSGLYLPKTPDGFEKRGSLLVPKSTPQNIDTTMYDQMRKQ
jgi:hypothetical protein